MKNKISNIFFFAFQRETIKCNDLRSVLLLKEDFHACQPVKSSQLFILAKHRRITDVFLVKYHQKQKTGIIMELILESKICIKCLCAKCLWWKIFFVLISFYFLFSTEQLLIGVILNILKKIMRVWQETILPHSKRILLTLR